MDTTHILAGIIVFLLGLAAGAVLLWLISVRDRKKLIELRSELQVSEKALIEARERSEEREKAFEDIRSRMEGLQREKAVAETRMEETVKKMEEQKEILDRAQEKMQDAFRALSGESLKSNNRAFLDLAKESLEGILNKATGSFDKKEESIKGLVRPLEEALGKYERHLGELEKNRTRAYAGLEKQIESLMDSQNTLRKETGNLVTALRKPQVRGRWGEVTLKRVTELAGMTEYCDFTEQVSVNTDEGRLRPDMVVHLPSEREIVVDSKVSLDAYLDAIECDSEEERTAHLVRHAQQLKKHLRTLAAKSYWNQFSRTPEFVVMFIPGDSFLSAAIEQEKGLIEEGMEQQVIIATPTTLIALLRAIAYGWRQEQIAKSAKEIAALGREIYERFQPFMEHINRTGGALSQAVVSFNKMIMSLERRVLVSVRKFRELGATGDKELKEPQQIEQTPMSTQDK
ncbi:MAG: DNA recombination protein RmuC [Candidatus Omnitrophica bacterium]|nr:DNA recombination protein RmuC [Candidatus Omnitrophota bacterium]